jgi:hypothetical protein
MIFQISCTILYILEMDAAATRDAASMDVTDQRQAAREVQRAQTSREELVERLTAAGARG